jgi:glyoxylase-like metal-dependent hydrolase (beta-lactamase superfamily II)
LRLQVIQKGDPMSDTKPSTLDQPEVTAFFDAQTNTISYIIKEPSGNACAVIDSVMNMDYAAGRITFESADDMIKTIKDRGLELQWIIETHVHADHLSAAPYLQEKLGGKIGISEKIIQVQETFGKIFNEGTAFQRDGSQFDALFEDGDSYHVGQMQASVIATPGHTPACMVHVMGDTAFVGDTLFMPDGGSARADFPGGDAGILYDSIQKVLSLPDETRLFMCHDYGPNGRDIQWETTCGRRTRLQHPCWRRCNPRGLCENAHRARRHLGNAKADHSSPASQHAGGRSSYR